MDTRVWSDPSSTTFGSMNYIDCEDFVDYSEICGNGPQYILPNHIVQVWWQAIRRMPG